MAVVVTAGAGVAGTTAFTGTGVVTGAGVARRRTGRSGLLYDRSRLDRMRNHRLSCPLFMTAASHLPGDAGVDHIFTAAHTAANRQNRRIIGMIISPDSHGIGVMIAAVVVLQR